MYCICLSDLLAQSTKSQDAQNNKTSKSFPQAQLKRFKKNPAHTKSLQAQTKNKTQKFFFQPSQAQVVLNMFMPYTEGPKMDWTVNDGLYHRFLKWLLKCENILECDLAMLPEKGNVRKVLLGVVILAWTSMFLVACPMMN